MTTTTNRFNRRDLPIGLHYYTVFTIAGTKLGAYRTVKDARRCFDRDPSNRVIQRWRVTDDRGHAEIVGTVR